METDLIKVFKYMMNGDAVSDIKTFNDFVKDFIHYMGYMYNMEPDEVMDECGLVYMRGRK